MKNLFSLLTSAAFIILNTASANPYLLSFDQPANDWDSSALPIGNGRIGAMIYGNPLNEIIQFNEISLWVGSDNLSGDYDTTDANYTFGAYQNFGELLIQEAAAETTTWPSSASHSSPANNQDISASIDGSAQSKWCFEHYGQQVIWQKKYNTADKITKYSITSADDVPQRDPKKWLFQGSTNGTTWTTLDSRNLSSTTQPAWPFSTRYRTNEFTPATQGFYTYYRLVFTPYIGVPHFQVAEINLTKSTVTNNLVTEASRSLDISNSIHLTKWTKGGVKFQRETFASHPHQVMATRVTADQLGKLNFTIKLQGAHLETSRSESSTASGNQIAFSGSFTNGLRYGSKVRVIPTGGSMVVNDGNQLKLENCDSVVILHAAATDYLMKGDSVPSFRNGIDPDITLNSQLANAQNVGYDAMKASHIADYRELFDRVTLNLGAAPQVTNTANRLSSYQMGNSDNHLESLMFQYGRYLLISSSRNSLPANLQGLWNNNNNPPWASDYHVNINLQMSYWLAEPANLPECHKILFNFLDELKPYSRAASKKSFGANIPGWTMRTSVNPFGGLGWEWDMPSSAWLARHYWEHYNFSGDTAFLQQKAWPVMQEICQFWMARLITRADGKLVSPYGWSPEQGPREDGVSYDQEIIWDLFTNTIKAANVLGNNNAFRDTLLDFRSRLLVPGIGSWGQIMEWTTEKPTLEHSRHRHTSHLFGVYPGFQFNAKDSNAYLEAAKVSLTDRGSDGDARRSWTWSWRTALWSRMNEPNKAHDMIRGCLTYNTMSNLYTTHPPFQIDGNLGMPGGMCEMLLQSHMDEIYLPVPPTAWNTGSFTGLKSRGGFEVSAAWTNGTHTNLSIKSLLGKNVKLKLPSNLSLSGVQVASNGSSQFIPIISGLAQFTTTPGSVYAVSLNSNDFDSDNDSFIDSLETMAGTNPNSATSFPNLQIQQVNGQIELKWNQIANRRYILEYSTNLNEVNWQVISNTVSTNTNPGIYLTPVTNDRGFYRLKITMP